VLRVQVLLVSVAGVLVLVAGLVDDRGFGGAELQPGDNPRIAPTNF
jgi:hypothetical protein